VATTNDEAGQLGPDEAGTTPDHLPRTVAEEAALLVDLLSRRGWGAGSGMPSASSRTPADDSDERHHDGPGHHDAAHHDAGHAHAGARPGGIPLGDGRPAPECTCGGREPAACKVCPVCQLISFVQQVNPDTIERVADFVGFAATALRDLATSQRERAARPTASAPSDDPTPTPTSTPPPTSRPEAARDDAQEGPT
jgi:hypothetical protein